MSARVPLVLLPRELGQVPPPPQLVGHKGHGLAQLLSLKARVPRFGILTAEAFDAHLAQDDIQATLAAARATSVATGGWSDDASRLTHGDALVRAVLRNPLPGDVKVAVQELAQAFAVEDLLAVRASVVGEPLESSVLGGALDSALGVRGRESLEEAILRILSLAFHPRTLGLREGAGLAPLGCRLAVVVQRMVQSESSGVCLTLGAQTEAVPRTRIRACWGLAGGIGGKAGSARIPCDVVHVERPVLAADGLDEEARLEFEIATKEAALRIDDSAGRGTRMQPVADHLKDEACLSGAQARLLAKEALRLETAFGKPQVLSWAYAGRLLHILDVEPLLVPMTRVESARTRTWDDRLLPGGLSSATPLTFSVWQRAAARGLERAGRILGVKGVILEETRPQMPRVLGHVRGRVYGNVEVLTALLDLLPFADKARAAVAAATGQVELVPRRAPPPGFWQRQRQRLDEGRWPGQLEDISVTATKEGGKLAVEVEACLRRMAAFEVGGQDPDALVDAFDELEDALSKVIAALVMSGLSAALFRVELEVIAQDTELRSHLHIVNDLLGGEMPPALFELTRRVYALAELARGSASLRTLLVDESDRFEATAARLLGDSTTLDDDERRFGSALKELLAPGPASCTGDLTLEAPRLSERPEHVLRMVLRLLDSTASPAGLLAAEQVASGTRKKAEYTVEQLGLKVFTKKRFFTSLEGVRKHGRESSLLWLLAERVVGGLREVMLALGERLFEHGLIDQPKDILHLTHPEIAGLVRGTGTDLDGKPLVAARKRQAAARPAGLPRRLETRGVVSTSAFEDDDDHEVTSPGEAKELLGRSVCAGEVHEISMLLEGGVQDVVRSARALTDRHRPPVTTPTGVVLVQRLALRDLPLLLVAKAVVAERGTVWSPPAYALRALGVPTVVDAPQITGTFVSGEPLQIDGARASVRRAPTASVPAPRPPRVGTNDVEAMLFAREAVLSDPRGLRSRFDHPAITPDGHAMPPLIPPITGSISQPLATVPGVGKGVLLASAGKSSFDYDAAAEEFAVEVSSGAISALSVGDASPVESQMGPPLDSGFGPSLASQVGASMRKANADSELPIETGSWRPSGASDVFSPAPAPPTTRSVPTPPRTPPPLPPVSLEGPAEAPAPAPASVEQPPPPLAASLLGDALMPPPGLSSASLEGPTEPPPVRAPDTPTGTPSLWPPVLPDDDGPDSSLTPTAVAGPDPLPPKPVPQKQPPAKAARKKRKRPPKTVAELTVPAGRPKKVDEVATHVDDEGIERTDIE